MTRLIDRAWPLAPLGLLGLALVIVVIGLLAAPAETPQDRIAGTVEDFAAAVDERRGEDACALLTPAAAKATADSIGTLGCATVVRSFGFAVDTGPLRVATILRADVNGTKATIPADQLIVPGGKPFGPGIALERVDGQWRVAGFT
ncbi:MAG: hypothetical protein H0V81_08435 [Solirubrobacterales bacterium]|nr:hypothetical protein [Solirubrobacterales bacterium]